MKERLEALGIATLRELAYSLERVLGEGTELRAKSIEDLVQLVEPALSMVEQDDPAAYDALVAEFSLDEDILPQGAQPDEPQTEESSTSADAAASADVEEPPQEGVELTPARKGPYDYVQIAAHGLNPGLQYQDIVPDPTSVVYEGVPYYALTSVQAQRAVQREGAVLNVDPRWSHGAHEDWARRHLEKG